MGNLIRTVLLTIIFSAIATLLVFTVFGLLGFIFSYNAYLGAIVTAITLIIFTGLF